jgi:hypothetical protein
MLAQFSMEDFFARFPCIKATVVTLDRLGKGVFRVCVGMGGYICQH